MQYKLISRIGYGAGAAKDLLILYALLQALRFLEETTKRLVEYRQHPVTEIAVDISEIAICERLSKELEEISHIYNDKDLSRPKKLYKLSCAFIDLQEDYGQLFAIKISNYTRLILRLILINIKRSGIYLNIPILNIALYNLIHALPRLILGIAYTFITCMAYNVTLGSMVPNLALSLAPKSCVSALAHELPTAHSLLASFREIFYRFKIIADLLNVIQLKRTCDTEQTNSVSYAFVKAIENTLKVTSDSPYLIINTIGDIIKDCCSFYINIYPMPCARLSLGISTVQMAWKLWRMGLFGIAQKTVNTIYKSGYKSAMDFALQSLTPVAISSFVNMKSGFHIWETNLMSFESKNKELNTATPLTDNSLNIVKYAALVSTAAIGIKYAFNLYKRRATSMQCRVEEIIDEPAQEAPACPQIVELDPVELDPVELDANNEHCGAKCDQLD